MAYYITIDGGTTNTRLYLFADHTLLGTLKLPVGASNGRQALIDAVRGGIVTLCGEHGMDASSLSRVIASGMIGSEMGLCDAARVCVPASVEELRSALVTVTLPGVSPVPITFIPGLLQSGDTEADCDLIRGEETEALGLLSQIHPTGDTALLLPGTHNKLMLFDGDFTVQRFYTAMSGDLMRAAAEHTILSASLDGGFSKEYDASDVLRGYDLCESLGLTAALFKLRVGDKVCGKSVKTLYGMLLGMVLHEDVRLLFAVYQGKDVIVAGSEPFRTALHVILCARTSMKSVLMDDALVMNAVPFGALMIALER